MSLFENFNLHVMARDELIVLRQNRETIITEAIADINHINSELARRRELAAPQLGKLALEEVQLSFEDDAA